MSRGYRSIILAAFGFIALYGFGLGYYHAALNYPQEKRYQPYREAADKVVDIDPALLRPASTKSLKYRAPCDEPKGKDESDLCAQWRAANAGEDSAFWAKWGFWIGVVGSGFLLWQIILTRQAVEDTGNATKAMLRANEIAEEMGQAQVRAYVSIIKATWKFNPEFSEATYIFEMENSGATPAKNVSIFGRTIIFNEGKFVWASPAPEINRVAGIDVPAGFKWSMRHLSFGDNLDLRWGDLTTKGLTIYLTTWLVYNDVFGNEIVDIEDWQVVRVLGEPRPVIRIDRNALRERDDWPT